MFLTKYKMLSSVLQDRKRIKLVQLVANTANFRNPFQSSWLEENLEECE